MRLTSQSTQQYLIASVVNKQEDVETHLWPKRICSDCSWYVKLQLYIYSRVNQQLRVTTVIMTVTVKQIDNRTHCWECKRNVITTPPPALYANLSWALDSDSHKAKTSTSIVLTCCLLNRPSTTVHCCTHPRITTGVNSGFMWREVFMFKAFYELLSVSLLCSTSVFHNTIIARSLACRLSDRYLALIQINQQQVL